MATEIAIDTEISLAPWDLSAGNRWTLKQDGYTDHGNESIVAKDGQIVAWVAGGMENGNGALLAAAPTLAEALQQIRDGAKGLEPFTWGRAVEIAEAALKKAGAL